MKKWSEYKEDVQKVTVEETYNNGILLLYECFDVSYWDWRYILVLNDTIIVNSATYPSDYISGATAAIEVLKEKKQEEKE